MATLCFGCWLEQLVPSLVEPELSRFRVHAVEPDSEFPIPNNRVVIVIDIDDSVVAPHQSRSTKHYYYRVAGHSKPAPHFYLESLRNRLAKPQLTASISDAKVIRAFLYNDSVFVQALVAFTIANDGNVTPIQWHLDLHRGDQRIVDDGAVTRTNFPEMSIRFPDANRVLTAPILPGRKLTNKELLGFTLPTNSLEYPGLKDALSDLLESMAWTASLITDSYRGSPDALDVAVLREKITSDDIRRFVPKVNATSHSGNIGGDVLIHNFTFDNLNRIEDTNDHLNFRGEIENSSNTKFMEFMLVVGFRNKDSTLLGHITCDIGLLPPGVRRPWHDWIAMHEIVGFSEIEYFYYDLTWTK
jgi:hypothetical protein